LWRVVVGAAVKAGADVKEGFGIGSLYIEYEDS